MLGIHPKLISVFCLICLEKGKHCSLIIYSRKGLLFYTLMEHFLLTSTRYDLLKDWSVYFLSYEAHGGNKLYRLLLKVEDAVESLSREILTIQGRGDKDAAEILLAKHAALTPPLKSALEKLEMIKVKLIIFCYNVSSIFCPC